MNFSPDSSHAWIALKEDFQRIKDDHLQQLFQNEPKRFQQFSLEWKNWLLDFSKNRIDQQVFEHLLDLAKEMDLDQAIEAMFSGKLVNFTERRPALHSALRNRSNEVINLDGHNVMNEVNGVLSQMKTFVNQLRTGEWKGHTGKPIDTIVHIGIGGSHLGPEMICEALRPYWEATMNIHFLANIDGSDVKEMLQKIDPETTLFIIASKSFTTQETLTNAYTIREWFLGHKGFPESAIKDHFIALSTNTEGVRSFGIDPAHMFRFWDWVGGRFSLWSAIGLPIACMIGFERFEELLEGAHAMDLHFKEAPYRENIPVTMAMLSIWYNNFFEATTEAVLPYNEYLNQFPSYLQQLTMESNGKRTKANGEFVNYATQQITWGDRGTNSQHSFFQLLHQGTRLIPADFITTVNPQHDYDRHHQLLIANCFAQSEALMVGKDISEVKDEMERKGYSDQEIENLSPHKIFPGNQPSNTLVMDQLTPFNLGALCAAYEHKVFVKSIIWNIDAFDQWGVELGKTLAKNIDSDLSEMQPVESHDSSTNGLIQHFKANKKK